MVLDTSAIAAVLFDEPERPEFVRKIAATPRITISSATLIESSIVVEARHGDAGGRELDLFLHRAGVVTIAVDDYQAGLARAAWRRYGKGRNPAALDFGDLFAYALAKATGDELLFKGEDFSRTDIAAA